MITDLKKLEKNIGFSLKNNTFCLAFDTATKSGVAMIYVNADKVKIMTELIKIPALPKDLEDKNEKYEAHLSSFLKEIRTFKAHLQVGLDNKKKYQKLLVLENSFLKMNVVTFGFLRALQGIVYAELYDIVSERKIIFPVTARNLVGFKTRLAKGSNAKAKKQEIMDWMSNIIEEKIEDDNCADALVLAFAGLKNDN